MESVPARVEVAIIGGGIAGLATAWAIRERAGRDVQVAIFERDATLASHASGRNAAMCRALAEDDAWTAMTAAGAAFLRRPPAGFADVPLVDGRGAVLLAGDAIADELVARAARFALRGERIGADEVRRRWPGLRVTRGGVWFPDDGNIELGALIQGFRGGAHAQVVTGAEVLELRGPRAGHGVTVTTSRGVVEAAQVVIAAGAWADDVSRRAGAPALGLVSRRRHVIALDARATEAGDAPIVWNVDGDEWYARPAGDEVWTSACDSEIVEAGEVAVRDGAVDEARARLPAPLDGAALVRAWACQRTFAAGAPVVARDGDRPWLVRVVGLGGHGVTASAAIGRAAAAVVLDP